MEVIGKSTCQPVGDCGSGTWGKIAGTYNTLFVDGSHSGGSPDGSRNRPYTTIGAALARVGKNGHVALAAGTYNEELSISTEGLTLEGRCAAMVTIKGKTPGWGLWSRPIRPRPKKPGQP
jgi:hypothetical protein